MTKARSWYSEAVERPWRWLPQRVNAGGPFLLSFAALVGATLLVDALLHLLGAGWIGRHLGWPGLLLIVGSFGNSLRKQGVIKSGTPAGLLRLHERLAWAESLLLLVHSGIHFYAILAWLAVLAMLINIGSGLKGKFLLQRGPRPAQSHHPGPARRGAWGGGAGRPALLGQPDVRDGH